VARRTASVGHGEPEPDLRDGDGRSVLPVTMEATVIAPLRDGSADGEALLKSHT
jgi:hypothetical protein